MNGNFLLAVTLLCVTSLGLSGQIEERINLRGKVVDAKTGNPVPFANMGVVGSTTGAATDTRGDFDMMISKENLEKEVAISAVGYEPYHTSVKAMRDKAGSVWRLEPVVYNIDEVNVVANAMLMRGILRKAVAAIPQNYVQVPFGYDGYYQYRQSVDESEPWTKEALVRVYDDKGYHRSDPATDYRSIHYGFLQMRSTRNIPPIEEYVYRFDDVVTADVVRHTQNIFDLEWIEDYQFEDKGRFLFEEDSVQVIGYSCAHPELYHSGDVKPLSLSGELYINISDHAVIRSIMHITSESYSHLGRSFHAEKGLTQGEVAYTITTNYRRSKHYYFLSDVAIEYAYSEASHRYTGTITFLTGTVNLLKPYPVSGRSYLAHIEKNDEFWDAYTISFSAE